MNDVFFVKATLGIAIAVLFVMFIYTKMQKPSEMQKYASMLTLNTILMLWGSLIEMKATTLEGAYYGTILSYMGEPFLLVSVFMLICTFYGVKIPRWAFDTMMAVAIIVTVSVYTNSYHHLYYSYVGFNWTAKYSPLVLRHGPLYILNIATIVFYNFGIAFMVIRGFIKTKSKLKRRLSIYSFLMMISALSGIIVYYFDLADGFDTTMFGLTAGTVFLSILFFRCKIFDVVDQAKDYALDASSDGLMIYDDSGNLVYINHTAENVVGKNIANEDIGKLTDETSLFKNEESVYSVTASSIKHKDEYLGKSIEIHDITESYTHQARLESAVAKATEKLEYIQRTIFGAFASLVEARNFETGDHIKRVSAFTEMIADSLSKDDKYKDILTEDYINIIVQSAPLHDLGKISVPDAVLLKPGKLTEEEFEIIKKHAEAGANVIRQTMGGLESDIYVQTAADIAMYHHERWDGTGYPKGINGEEIPLCARIVAVADCYDAMTSKRCYKDAFPVQEALDIIKEESGTHFDPEVAAAFLRLAEEHETER